jgi:DnaK suppressor protein
MEKPEKTRFSDEELQEFRDIISRKMVIAREELKFLQDQLKIENENGTDDTGSVYKTMEDGNSTLQKENNSNLAARQKKFIDSLEAAMMRIENKTYGLCKVTGKLISKERLRAVPHTTQSIEAKNNQYRV